MGAFTQLLTNLNNHQGLPTYPSEEGYSDTQLQQLFDKAPNDIKEYINNTLLIELAESGATEIGTTEIEGIPGDTVQVILEGLKTYIDSNFDSGDDIVIALDTKADKTNVLELNNTEEYTPSGGYNPATKKFVEDLIENLGSFKSIEEIRNDTTEPLSVELRATNPSNPGVGRIWLIE